MFRPRHASALFFTLALLQGCVGKPEIPFDRAASSSIKTIGMVTPKLPSGAAVVLATSVGKNLPGALGIIGVLVDAGMQSKRESTFQAALTAQDFSFEAVLEKSLTDCLIAGGYAVSLVPVKRDSNDFLKKYPIQADAKIDAYLDIVVSGYGYIAAGIDSSTPYRPGVTMRVRLVSAKDFLVLMEDAISYNPINALANTVTIAPAAEYQFADFDSLTANPKRATDNLKSAISESEIAACKLLR